MRNLSFALLLALLAGPALAQEKKDEKKPDETKKDEPKKEEPKKEGQPAPAPAATSDYFPLVKGAKWTYLMGQTEVVVEVDSVSADGAKLVTKHQGKPVADEVIKVTADGVYRTKINSTAIDGGGVKILALENGAPKKGAKWKVDTKVQQSAVSGEFEVKEVGTTVKVPASEYKDAVFVEGPKFMIAGTETAVRYWFAPKVGVVKLSYSIAGSDSAPLELKSYETPK